ncbi:hypothetical protein Hore_18090 [Halothermothrix orenii H 168]|uniref:Flavodoxin-like domain-containing protein n=1 Tax=Halothermothrix orenii (strain H 168 / OCM 544 / DSM 9562) TaxID=373903 RepID=B8CZ39_HALOH|nr:hypothetical protein Hore_18090 [Halothermothrix orenii H 168]
MQKILIIHSEEGNIEEIARGIAEGARKNGHQVDILSTRDRGRVVSFFPYDLILVGSPTRGIFKGKIGKDLPPYLRECKRTAGKTAMAFVTPRFFATTTALKKVMAELEKLGCFVKNFASLKNRGEAVRFGEKL